MVQRVRLDLKSDEYEGLLRLCEEDLRSVPDEARHLIREALRERGLLSQDIDQQRAVVGRA
jgi:hypothetical protein